MPIYTNNPCDDGLFPVEHSLRSSIGIGPKVTKAIDAATKDWLDNHPEATTTVEDDSLTNVKLKDGSVNSRVIEDESITTDDIADLAITTPKIADNAVTSDKVASSAVDGLRIMSTTQLGVAKIGAGLAMNNDALELDGNGDIAAAVTAWLNAHPEATTTVQDNSLDGSLKLIDGSVSDSKLVQTGGVLNRVDNYLIKSSGCMKNKLNDLSDYVERKYWNPSNGVMSDNASYSASMPIWIHGVKKIYISNAPNAYTMVFFDANMDFISGTSVGFEVTVPELARFVGFSFLTDDSDTIKFLINPNNNDDDIILLSTDREELDRMYEKVSPSFFTGYGYIKQDGTGIQYQSSGNNTYKEFNFSEPFDAFFSWHGKYYSGWPMVVGVNSDNEWTVLYNSSGVEESATIFIDSANEFVRLIAWSDSSQASFSFDIVNIEKIVNEVSQSVENIVKSYDVVVATDGSGDYDNLKDALDYLRSRNTVTTVSSSVYIKNGVYNIATDPDNRVAINKGANRISIHGESRDGVILRITNTPSVNNQALQIGGPCIIENITIESLWYDDGTTLDNSHNAYCLHNDVGFAASESYTTEVKNCRFYSEGFVPLGAGLHDYQKQRYVECVFEYDPKVEYASGSYLGAFYVHAPFTSTDRNCSLEVDDCVCISKSAFKAIACGNVAGSLTYDQIPTTFRRTIAVSNGQTVTDVSQSSHQLTPDSQLNNVESLNYSD